MVLEVYDGVEPVAATSARFAVRVRQEVGRVRSPHVYVTLSPDAQLEQVHPPNFCALLPYYKPVCEITSSRAGRT